MKELQFVRRSPQTHDIGASTFNFVPLLLGSSFLGDKGFCVDERNDKY